VGQAILPAAFQAARSGRTNRTGCTVSASLLAESTGDTGRQPYIVYGLECRLKGGGSQDWMPHLGRQVADATKT